MAVLTEPCNQKNHHDEHPGVLLLQFCLDHGFIIMGGEYFFFPTKLFYLRICKNQDPIHISWILMKHCLSSCRSKYFYCNTGWRYWILYSNTKCYTINSTSSGALFLLHNCLTDTTTMHSVITFYWRQLSRMYPCEFAIFTCMVKNYG